MLVDLKEIEEEDFNLNIRRYVDNSPEPEPQDIKAHLHGGIPKGEWNNKLLSTYGIKQDLLFKEKTKEYFLFKDVSEREQIKELLEKSAGFNNADSRLKELMLKWFKSYGKEIRQLRQSRPVHELLDSGFTTLQKALEGNGILDEFQTRGVFINWWNENKFDLRTIKETGWVQSLISNFDFESEEKRAVEETLEKIKYFFKEMFDSEISEIEKLEERERELSSEIDEEAQAEELENGEQEPLDKVLKREIKDLKAEIKECNKTESVQQEHLAKTQKMLAEKEAELDRITAKQSLLKQVRGEIKEKNSLLIEKVRAAIEKLGEDDAEKMVMQKLEDSALSFLNTYLTAQKQKIITYFENLWDKYGVDVRAMEKERDTSAKELNKYLEELGYE